MRVHLIHGIHSNGVGSTGKLAPYFRADDFDVFARRYGDAIVCHSNGAAVAYLIQADHRELSALILINPALDRDTEFHNTRRVLCLHNAAVAVRDAQVGGGKSPTLDQGVAAMHDQTTGAVAIKAANAVTQAAAAGNLPLLRYLS